ncbi:hypothetical protein JV173_01480 [Acholeplasma equirhinis]|uniref:hypothetical protein n=1 Tax=Acholeplasma equirhinis TaxID=555393 RepID=UPI00197AEF87|nr:hypothetical protein [Acholeplasma equirhinis]MBN3490175.1 hypothetical protein [Acholeplasma equirhinis]
MRAKLHQNFIYITKNISESLRQSGMFIAVKIIVLFIQTYANKQLLTYSNNDLVEKLGIKRLSSLHSAFKILESDGIIVRTFKDTKKRIRGEFKLDVDKAIKWLSTTIYDEMYLKADKRSLFRAVVRQTLLIIKDVKSRVIQALGNRKTEDRNARVKAIAERSNKLYDKYIKHLERRSMKQQEINSKKHKSIRRSQVVQTFADMLRSFGYVPPENYSI